MPRLVLRVPGENPRHLRLESKPLRLGRSPDCEVVIEHEGISRMHAVLRMASGRIEIEDLGSRNGTYVNDESAGRRALQAGDVVRLGQDVELELAQEAAEAAPDAGQAGRPVVAKRGARPAATRRAGVLRRREFVLVPQGASGRREVPVRERVLTVGREAPARLIVDDESVSRVHARLDWERGALTVTDLKSRNGTLVNGSPVLRAALRAGDTLQFGNVSFTVDERETWAQGQIRLIAFGIVLIAGLAVGAAYVNDWLVERQAIREAHERVRREAVASVRKGISYYEQGELDYAASSLLYAADALLFSGLAVPGSSLDRPDRVFQSVLGELPADERDFDFAKALDPRTAAAGLRLEDLSPHEYVRRQVKRVAIELGQDENVPEGFSEEVWAYVRESMTYPRSFQTILNRSVRYQPMLRQRLAAAHLPEMFCYVAWVESGLDPKNLSGAGALGLWQLMADVGRENGLRVDPAHGIDERTDPERSTDAAAREIARLLNRFGPEQFMLALASYNRGWTGVMHAVEGISDPMMPSAKRFWYLVESHKLPRETSEYVPRIFAMRIMGADPARFGFKPPAGSG